MPPSHATRTRFSPPAVGNCVPHQAFSQGLLFKIAGGTAGVRVSWMVTGIRQDAWANANRILVEEDKPALERGSYLHPELYAPLLPAITHFAGVVGEGGQAR